MGKTNHRTDWISGLRPPYLPIADHCKVGDLQNGSKQVLGKGHMLTCPTCGEHCNEFSFHGTEFTHELFINLKGKCGHSWRIVLRHLPQSAQKEPALTLILSSVESGETYDEYLRSPGWQETRKAALQRADHHCQFCNSPDRLEVHHRTYERLGTERPGDLIVLCHECHTTLHAVENGRPTRMPVQAD